MDQRLDAGLSAKTGRDRLEGRPDAIVTKEYRMTLFGLDEAETMRLVYLVVLLAVLLIWFFRRGGGKGPW